MKFNFFNRLAVLVILIMTVFGCGGMKNFVILETVNDKSVGFVDGDTLQVVGTGYAGFQTLDSKEKMVQAKAAAVIKARMNVLDYLLSEVKAEDNKEYYISLVTKIGEFLSIRYDPIYGKTLLDGGAKVDGIFNLLNLKGYTHKISYDAAKGFCKVTYRVVQANLREKAKRGFSE